MSSQVASLFKPTSKGGNGEPSSNNVPQATGQPLTYAEFIVQSKTKATQGNPHRPKTEDVPPKSGSSTELSTEFGKPQTRTRENEGPGPTKAASQTTAVTERQEEHLAEEKKAKEGQSTEELSVASHLSGSGNSIIVSPRQVRAVLCIRIVE